MKTGIGDRFKEYEGCFSHTLPSNSFVIIRLDMRAGHTYTRGMEAFDDRFISDMQHTAIELAKEVSNCKFGFVQSDEISLVLYDGNNINTEPYFGNKLNKLVSITASVATSAFNRRCFFREVQKHAEIGRCIIPSDVWEIKLPQFDSRAFIVPNIEEVVNYFIWRQRDWTKNSIQMLGRKYFSTKDLHGLNGSQIQDKLIELGINWNDMPIHHRRGTSIIKKELECITDDGDLVMRNVWFGDCENPIFSVDKDYILSRL